MGKVEKIEREIKALSQQEMAELRDWFATYEGETWDRQFASDVRAGKLDPLAEKALQARASGTTTEL